MAQRFNFDDYASKGSTVHPVKKYHRNLLALTAAEPGSNLATQATILDGK